MEIIRKTAYKPAETKESDQTKNILNKLDEKKEGKYFWTAEEIGLLKDGLKKFADVKDPKEKFQTIATHVKTKT